MAKAIVLLSGGLDSVVLLAIALKNKRDCRAISFDYGQRHRVELESAKALAKYYQVEHRVIGIDVDAFAPNALLTGEGLQCGRSVEEIEGGGQPNTLVPGRNTLFLAYTLGQALQYEAEEIYFGANVMDANPYPDCRPDYVEAMQKVIHLSTGMPDGGPRIVTPLLYSTKKEIITLAKQLEVPLELTLSCYGPTEQGEHCGVCDACVLRKKGFLEASVEDPTHYFR